jgi:hypothetical protein
MNYDGQLGKLVQAVAERERKSRVGDSGVRKVAKEGDSGASD